jgi:hypothetical protein
MEHEIDHVNIATQLPFVCHGHVLMPVLFGESEEHGHEYMPMAPNGFISDETIFTLDAVISRKKKAGSRMSRLSSFQIQLPITPPVSFRAFSSTP